MNGQHLAFLVSKEVHRLSLIDNVVVQDLAEVLNLLDFLLIVYLWLLLVRVQEL